MDAAPATPTRSPAKAEYVTPGSATSAALGHHRFAAGDAVMYYKSLQPDDAPPADRQVYGGTVLRVADSKPSPDGTTSTLYAVQDNLTGREVIISSKAMHRVRY
jgi:hypothetical protein